MVNISGVRYALKPRADGVAGRRARFSGHGQAPTENHGQCLLRFPDIEAQILGDISLGVLFDDELISRVRIRSGNTALGPNDDPGEGIDVAVTDDFLYSEPFVLDQVDDGVIPEPASASLTLGALAALGLMGARRRRG